MVDSTSNFELFQNNANWKPTNNNKFAFDVDKMLEKARKGEILDEVSIKLICGKVKEILQ